MCILNLLYIEQTSVHKHFRFFYDTVYLFANEINTFVHLAYQVSILLGKIIKTDIFDDFVSPGPNLLVKSTL